jgi:hypothetical protein
MEGIAVIEVPLDRPGLAPEKLRRRRQQVVVEAVRRRGEQRRVAAAVLWQIDRDRDGHAVAHADVLDPGRRDVVIGSLQYGRREQRDKHHATASERLEHGNLPAVISFCRPSTLTKRDMPLGHWQRNRAAGRFPVNPAMARNASAGRHRPRA